MTTKICSKCKQDKELSCFPFYKYKGEQKRKAHCKDCQRKLHKDWYEKNEKYAKSKRKEYVEKNRDAISQQRKKYYMDNIEELKRKDRENYYNNRDEMLAKKKEYYRKNIENSRAYARERYWKNLEENRSRSRKYWDNPENDEKRKEAYRRRISNDPDFFKRYYEMNKDRYMEHNARRRSLQKNSSLNLSEEQIQQMRDTYWLARDLTTITGEPYEVDHIIPLRGKDICGLHVPWNLQVLPMDLNRSKNNRYNANEVLANPGVGI